MPRLHTLGSVFVAADSGEPLEGIAAQRRNLALLTLLMMAGEGGLSRDKLVGLLWPETDPERARHSLTQAIYAAKRALQADDLFSVNADIRLNRERLGSDVTELEAALDAGHLEQAVTLYAGPFLDGFFLSGSPEFEQWSSSHRARLEARVAEALEQLARAAETQGDYRRSVEWRKRVSAMRPLDSGNTVRLMLALAETGDRAGALQQARVHELLLRDQLQLEPDAAVLDLCRKLREPVPATAQGTGKPASKPAPATPEQLEISSAGVEHPAATTLPPPNVLPAWFPIQLVDSWKLIGGILLGLSILAVAAITLTRGPQEPPIAPPAQLRQKVVVAPFRVAGASSSLRYLGDGIVELLSTRLADDTAARAVDAGAVLGAWEGAGFTAGRAIPRDSVVKLAAQLGAERVVIGSVVGTPSRMILRASVVAVPSAVVSGEAMVEGTADSISGLIDGLAAKLLVSQAGEDESLAGYTTTSLPALRAYLAAQAAFRRDDYAAASRRYERALELDPTFPLAALHLALAADRQNDAEQRRRGVAQAWASRVALSERDLAILIGLAGPKYPLPSLAGEQLTAWRRLVDLAPSDAGAWYLLGARLFHDGAVAGVPGTEARAAATLERALSIDPDHAPARLILHHLGTMGPASSLAGDPFSDTTIAESLEPFAPFLRWRLALARADTTGLRRIRESLRRLDAFNLRAISMASQFDGRGLADGSHAMEILAARPTSRSDRLDVLLGQHSLMVQQGRPQAALGITNRVGALLSGAHAHLRLRMLDALYAEGDTVAAQVAARELEALTGGGLAAAAFASDTRLADLCVLSQWRAVRGDTAGMVNAIDALQRAAATMRYLPPVSAAPAACAELLGGWFAVLRKKADALGRVERLDSLALTSQTTGDAIAYAPLLIARLYEGLGQPGRALLAIRKRSYMSGWPRYLATAWREEGRLAQIVGDSAGARTAYQRYLALRPSPEESVKPQVEQVRALLGSIGTSAAP